MLMIHKHKLLDDLAKLIAEKSPKLSQGKICIRGLFIKIGVFVENVPHEFIEAVNKENYPNPTWFKCGPLYGIVTQENGTIKVIPLYYCPGDIPKRGLVTLVDGTLFDRLPDELYRLYFVLNQDITI